MQCLEARPSPAVWPVAYRVNDSLEREDLVHLAHLVKNWQEPQPQLSLASQCVEPAVQWKQLAWVRLLFETGWKDLFTSSESALVLTCRYLSRFRVHGMRQDRCANKKDPIYGHLLRSGGLTVGDRKTKMLWSSSDKRRPSGWWYANAQIQHNSSNNYDTDDCYSPPPPPWRKRARLVSWFRKQSKTVTFILACFSPDNPV